MLLMQRLLDAVRLASAVAFYCKIWSCQFNLTDGNSGTVNKISCNKSSPKSFGRATAQNGLARQIFKCGSFNTNGTGLG